MFVSKPGGALASVGVKEFKLYKIIGRVTTTRRHIYIIKLLQNSCGRISLHAVDFNYQIAARTNLMWSKRKESGVACSRRALSSRQVNNVDLRI